MTVACETSLRCVPRQEPITQRYENLIHSDIPACASVDCLWCQAGSYGIHNTALVQFSHLDCLCLSGTGDSGPQQAMATGMHDSGPAAKRAAHPRLIVWRIRGEVQQSATYPQVRPRMTAV